MRTISDLVLGGETPPSFEPDLVKSGGVQASVPKAWFTDPFALLDSLGLGYKSSPSGLSYETLKQMSEHNVIVNAIIQTRCHQVASFTIPQQNKYSIGYRVSHKDKNRRLTEGELNFVKYLERFIERCGEDKNPDRDDLEVAVLFDWRLRSIRREHL